MKANLKKNQKANFYKILLDTAKIVTIEMHNSCEKNLSILVSAFILVIEVWMVVKEFSDLSMTRASPAFDLMRKPSHKIYNQTPPVSFSQHVFVCAVSDRLFRKKPFQRHHN